MNLSKKLRIDEIVGNKNIADLLEKGDLEQIGAEVLRGFEQDIQSRSEWEARSAGAIAMALQVREAKNFPWINASNVKFPLITIAALQFLARISIMTKGKIIARASPIGLTTDEIEAACDRISEHMSYQLTSEMTGWINSDEQAKIEAAIIGASFKKTYFDVVSRNVVSEHVNAANIVIDYFAKDIESASRVSHIVTLDKNEITERVRVGIFHEVDSEQPVIPRDTPLAAMSDKSSGLEKPVNSDVVEVIEQHRFLDLDGDGYEEPYIVSCVRSTGQVLRIAPRFYDSGDVYRANDAKIAMLQSKMLEAKTWDEQSAIEKEIAELQADKKNSIVRIEPHNYFTRILFIPSPDGGIYGLGLGTLMGPVNETINTVINQLVDAGTMANTAGGFLGRGVKIKSGTTSFMPFEWKPVDSTGDDLRKNIIPLPTKEPSPVLFSLLELLITYAEKISGATDIMTGIMPGQNTPAETSRNTIEQGMMLFSGIYARMYRSFSDELGKILYINKMFFKYNKNYLLLTRPKTGMLKPDDYYIDGIVVKPNASAEAVTASQLKQKWAELMAIAQTTPVIDRGYVLNQYLTIAGYDHVDRIFPKGDKAIKPAPNPKFEIERQKIALDAKKHSDTMTVAIAELQEKSAVNKAKILELVARSEALFAKADNADKNTEIALIEAQIGAANARQQSINHAIDALQKAIELERQRNETDQGRSAGMGGVTMHGGTETAAGAGDRTGKN